MRLGLPARRWLKYRSTRLSISMWTTAGIVMRAAGVRCSATKSIPPCNTADVSATTLTVLRNGIRDSVIASTSGWANPQRSAT